MIARIGLAALVVAIVAPAVLSLQAGCRSARREEPLVGAVDVNDPATRTGEIVYAQHCYQCHPGGRSGVGPALNNKPLPGRLIKLQVRGGLGAMPGFSEQRINDEQLGGLVKYIAALRKNK